jgi:hypothetical protein
MALPALAEMAGKPGRTVQRYAHLVSRVARLMRSAWRNQGTFLAQWENEGESPEQ